MIPTPPIQPDDNHNRIHKAAEHFQQCLEQMNMKNVVVLYVYTDEKELIHDGYQAAGVIHAIGACELIKHSILNDGDSRV